jgi:hypothetical protein
MSLPTRASVRCSHCGCSVQVDINDLKYDIASICRECGKAFTACASDRVEALFEIVTEILDHLQDHCP